MTRIGRQKKIALLVIAILVGAFAIHTALSMLQVTITNVGTVVGQTKELTISSQTAVTALGTVTVLPVCATALASSFADVSTASLNWGTSLASASQFETFFCVGNIGTSAGTIHVSVVGAGGTGDGSTVVVQSCAAGLTGLTFAALDGAAIAAGGVTVVHVALDTPTVAANGHVNLASQVVLTLS